MTKVSIAKSNNTNGTYFTIFHHILDNSGRVRDIVTLAANGAVLDVITDLFEEQLEICHRC